MVDMIDVSNFNGHVDWNQVKLSGCGIAYCHAFEYGPNTQSFPANWQGMYNAGVQRGAYCFARPSDFSAYAQATQFVGYVVSLGFGGSDFFVLDAEVAMTPDWALTFCQTIQQMGHPVSLYSGGAFMYDVLHADKRLQPYSLIVADYSVNDGNRHPYSYNPPWPEWAHQYTSVGHVPGVSGNVDCNDVIHSNLNPASNVPPPAHVVGDEDTMLIVNKKTKDIAIIFANHRPRKIASVNDYLAGTVVNLEDDAWQQYWQDAIKLYNSAVQ